MLIKWTYRFCGMKIYYFQYLSYNSIVWAKKWLYVCIYRAIYQLLLSFYYIHFSFINCVLIYVSFYLFSFLLFHYYSYKFIRIWKTHETRLIQCRRIDFFFLISLYYFMQSTTLFEISKYSKTEIITHLFPIYYNNNSTRRSNSVATRYVLTRGNQ